MRITSLSAQEKNNLRYNADYEDIVEFGIKAGVNICEEELEDLISRIQYKKAMGKALSMINIKVRSEQEVRKKLKEMDFQEGIIDKVTERLKELKYLDDHEFSRMWIEDRMKLKPVGRKMLIRDLKNKGVAPEVVDETINEFEINDLDTAVSLLKKKMGKAADAALNTDDRNKVYNRLYRYLLYRGMDYDTARKAISICLNCEIGE